MSSELQDIRDIRQWIETGQLDLAEIDAQLEWIVENGLTVVDKALEEKGPEQALADFTLLNAFLSAAPSQKPSLASILSSYVSQFKASAESLGKKLKADSVSVAVGFPWGVSFDLSWNI